ncbi:hypothetical protein [Rhodanobacter sp. MP1X3]|uniref:hypothetical protein n=1 Tax=Rhodanobacter sp. MP1X3 TaxID=2723086 RepID=UPI00160CDF08|nr:hypothetical protein [Rhodanobacter sp. MP1X3]MBB6241622.1 hypothetical protein [Rhodanobacter sp. MP1X3]
MAHRAFGNSAKWIYFIVFAFLAKNALAACTTSDWRHGLGRPEHGAIYFGVIGSHDVRMMLHLDPATDHLDGVYGYSDQPGLLELSGTLRADATGADLDERDSQGHPTGHISLSFAQHLEPWQDPVSAKEYPARCDAPLGTWQSLSTNKSRRIDLHRDGEWVAGNEGEEQMDDIVALKLRRAILVNDRSAFAALLQYPFYTVGFRSGFHAWNRPEDVIKYYAEIMRIPDIFVREAVPHVLAANATGAAFMRGSVYLAHGKVTMVCEGRCPIVANFEHPAM